MQRPRRTTESETPLKSSRQSRPSRLLQPIRRPSAHQRSSSAEPLNNLNVGGRLSASTTNKPRRSSSVCNARTPQRTPTHVTPLKASQFTGERQRTLVNDKRWLQDQVVKITDYLKTVDCGISTEFLNKGGLKTMSIKQFIGLVNYFLKFIGGNKFTVGTNHVESISKILNQIDYPYTVNKSWLKTPTAPHAFGNAIMLFSFFMEFIPPADNLHTFKKDYLIKSEEFPDMEYAVKLSDMAAQGFALWNNQKNEEFEKLQKCALDELIYKKISIPGCDALDEDINKLNTELDKILAETTTINDIEEFHRLDKELKTSERKILKLQKSREKNQKLCKELEFKINTQRDQIAKLKLYIEEIRKVIETQEISIEERNKLIEDFGQMQYILETKKKSVIDLQEIDNQSQVLLSRNIKQMTEKIAKFNSYIREIMLDFDYLDVDIDTLYVHQNSEVTELQDQINQIVVFLKKLHKHITNQIEELSKQCEAFGAQIKLISYELHDWIEPKTKEAIDCIKELQKKVDDFDREIIAVKNSTADRSNEFALKIKQVNLAKETLENLIESKKKEIVKVKEENTAMMALVSERFEQFLKDRDEKLKRFKEVLQLFQKKIAEAEAIIEY